MFHVMAGKKESRKYPLLSKQKGTSQRDNYASESLLLNQIDRARLQVLVSGNFASSTIRVSSRLSETFD